MEQKNQIPLHRIFGFTFLFINVLLHLRLIYHFGHYGIKELIGTIYGDILILLFGLLEIILPSSGYITFYKHLTDEEFNVNTIGGNTLHTVITNVHFQIQFVW